MPALLYLNLVTVDLENWNGTDRHYFNAIVPDQDLVEVMNNTSPHMVVVFEHSYRLTFQRLRPVCVRAT